MKLEVNVEGDQRRKRRLETIEKEIAAKLQKVSEPGQTSEEI